MTGLFTHLTRRNLTLQQQAHIVSRRNEGANIKTIADEIHVSYHTVRGWLENRRGPPEPVEPCKDRSGYDPCNRSFVRALWKYGVNNGGLPNMTIEQCWAKLEGAA